MCSYQLRGAVYDMKDTDNFGEVLCWVLHDNIVNDSLRYMLYFRAWLKHKRGKGTAYVGPSGNDLFESGGMMCYVIECVTLLAVYVFALSRSSGSVQSSSECIVWMYAPSW